MSEVTDERTNFECYQLNVGACPETGESTIYNGVMSALHELRRLDEEAKILADSDWFSKEGKLERLMPLQKKAAEEVARQQKRLGGYGAELRAAEDRLFSPPVIDPTDAVTVHADAERRDWFDKLNANERAAIVAEMRNGAHEDVVMALARSPTPGKIRGIGVEIWRARVEQKRGSEVRALVTRRRALEWAESALQAVNKYAATTPWSNKPAETAIDKMNRGRAGRSTDAANRKNMSRTKKLIPRGGLAKIQDLASRGHSEKDIARALGMSATTWTRLKNDHPEAQDALDEGRSVEHMALFGKLYEKAMSGDIVALLFLLKCRHGYRETLDVTQHNSVAVVFQIPAALDPAEYKKLISSRTPHG